MKSSHVAIRSSQLLEGPIGRTLVRAIVEKGAIDQPVPSEHVHHGEGERGVAARKRLQVKVSLLGGRMRDRVDHDHLPTQDIWKRYPAKF